MSISKMSLLGNEIVKLLKSKALVNSYVDWDNTPIHYAYYPNLDRILAAREPVLLVRPIARTYDRDNSDRCTTTWQHEYSVDLICVPGHDRTPKVTTDPTDPQPSLWEYIDSQILEDLMEVSEQIADILASRTSIGEGDLVNVQHDPLFNENALAQDNMFATSISVSYSVSVEKV